MRTSSRVRASTNKRKVKPPLGDVKTLDGVVVGVMSLAVMEKAKSNFVGRYVAESRLMRVERHGVGRPRFILFAVPKQVADALFVVYDHMQIHARDRNASVPGGGADLGQRSPAR